MRAVGLFDKLLARQDVVTDSAVEMPNLMVIANVGVGAAEVIISVLLCIGLLTEIML